jgi:hypothetical protein
MEPVDPEVELEKERQNSVDTSISRLGGEVSFILC